MITGARVLHIQDNVSAGPNLQIVVARVSLFSFLVIHILEHWIDYQKIVTLT